MAQTPDKARTGTIPPHGIAADPDAVGTQRTFDATVLQVRVDQPEPHIRSWKKEGTTGQSGPSPTVDDTAPTAAASLLPTNLTLPVITGSAAVGNTLTVTPGTWNDATTVTRKWQLDDVDIPGATGLTFITANTGVHRCIETATNASGSATAGSNTITVVPLQPPVSAVAPVITGQPVVGQVLTLTPGTWQFATTVTRVWRRDGVDIAGTTGLNVYTTAAAGVHTVHETAVNADGTVTADSNGINALVGAAPVNTVAPVITGTGGPGNTLTRTLGTWTGYPTPVLTSQWYRNNVIIAGATGATYAQTDYGSYVCRVTGTNLVSAVVANSNAIVSAPPLEIVNHVADIIVLSGGAFPGVSAPFTATGGKIIVTFTARNEASTTLPLTPTVTMNGTAMTLCGDSRTTRNNTMAYQANALGVEATISISFAESVTRGMIAKVYHCPTATAVVEKIQPTVTSGTTIALSITPTATPSALLWAVGLQSTAEAGVFAGTLTATSHDRLSNSSPLNSLDHDGAWIESAAAGVNTASLGWTTAKTGAGLGLEITHTGVDPSPGGGGTETFSASFGALTPANTGGAQVTSSTGTLHDVTSITAQPSTRWAVSGNKIVPTGTPAMVAETITATVGGVSSSVVISTIANTVSVASAAEFDAVNMTPAASGNFAIRLRPGVTITKAKATAKVCGTSGAHRVLGGTLTLTGAVVNGVQAARVEGIGPLWMDGGKFIVRDLMMEPAAGRNGRVDTTACVDIHSAPTTDVEMFNLKSVGNPAMFTWPGVTPNNGVNDYGTDPWGALVRVNAVSGVARPYADGQVTVGGKTGPDIVTFGTSGVKRVLQGIRNVGSGVYELWLGDRNGNHHGVDNALCSRPDPPKPNDEGACADIGIGNNVTGLDGFTATVVAPPAGVAPIGNVAPAGAAFTYLPLGPRWLDSNRGKNDPYTNTVKNLTIRQCDISAGDSLIQPSTLGTFTLLENNFHHFTQDCIKIPGNPGQNFVLIWGRNDLHSAMQGPADLYAAHSDYVQLFSDGTTARWNNSRIFHNRIGCFARACAQGIFNDSGSNALENSQVFGNIFAVENGGWTYVWKMASNVQHCHNTHVIVQKMAGLPANWAPNGGDGMFVSTTSTTPGTGLYVGWNLARRYASGSTLTEKNFGSGGNTSKTQLEQVAGLGGAEPLRITTYAQMMTACKTILAGADEKAGAVSSVTNWTHYPYYVTTDDAHLPFNLDYDPGVIPT